MSTKSPQTPADATPEESAAPASPAEGRSDTALDQAPPAADAEALQRERDELYDRLLRKTAEFENYRKRVEKERREQADLAIMDLLTELLTVVDDFERALAVESGPEDTAYRKGVELIHAKLHDLLRRFNVRAFESLGTTFDPNVHQAVMHEESPDHREGEVTGELQRGYMIGDRLLRPAMVKVAK